MSKRLAVFALVLVLFAPSLAATQDRGKVLLVIRDAKPAASDALEWMVTKEVGTIREMLQKAGYRVEIASPTGARWGTQAIGLQPNYKIADVRVADYKALVIPCLAIEATDVHPDLAALVKAAVAGGKVVAAQNGGVSVLAKTGVLAGKRYAALELSDAPEEFAKGIYGGNGVVRDGAIITSGICPWMAHAFRGMQDGTPQLMETLIAELK